MQRVPEEAAEVREREKLLETHRLTTTTYRNAEEFMEDMKSLAKAAKQYHKALTAMVKAGDHFYGLMETYGAKAANLPGSVRTLGSSMVDAVASYHATKESQDDWINSLNSAFIVPIEKKVKDEKFNLKRKHDLYRANNVRRTQKMKKSYKNLKKASKKKNPTRENLDKIMQLNQVYEEDKDMLHSHRVEGLRQALLDERKLYCFCLNRFCSFVQSQVSYNSKTHDEFSSHVIDWQTACTSPHELPPESTALLSDPRATRAFPPASSNRNDVMRQGNSMLADVLNSSNRPQPRRESCRVRAMYPHQSTDGADQLQFNPGDLIDAIDEEQDGWQYGVNTKTGRKGWFPVHYVKTIWPPQQSPQVRPSSGSANSLQRREGSMNSLPRRDSSLAGSPLQMGSSTTEREYLQQQHQQQGGSGSRRSSMTSVAMSHRS